MPEAHTLPFMPERGDVVTLKTEPGKPWTVLGFFVSVPSYYLLSHVSSERGGVMSTVRLCEIATIERPAPTLNGVPVEADWRDDETLATMLEEAEEVKPVLKWEQGDDGSWWSKDHRFQLCLVVGTWEAHDYEKDAHADFELFSNAKTWAENQVANPTVGNPLEWLTTTDNGVTALSKCGRFKILVGSVSQTFQSVDTFAHHGDLRFSSYASSLDDAKAWCQDRSRYEVRTEAGVERLVMVRAEDGSAIPF